VADVTTQLYERRVREKETDGFRIVDVRKEIDVYPTDGGLSFGR
jgi:hypothetical protein